MILGHELDPGTADAYQHLCHLETADTEQRLSDFFTDWHYSHNTIGESYCERPHLSLAFLNDADRYRMYYAVINAVFVS